MGQERGTVMGKGIQIIAAVSLVCVTMGRIHGEEPKGKQIPIRIDMPVPARKSGNTYAQGMSAVLSYLGTDASTDRVMGLTGVAFILQVDTNGPFVEGELDCAWWPNDAWGFDLGVPVLSKAVGWDIRKIRCNMEAYRANPAAEFARAFAPAIEQSLSSPLIYGGFAEGRDQQV